MLEHRLPLEGVRIVAMTQAWAGPYATTLLADWGAEVIKVENRFHFPVATRGLAVNVEGIIPNNQRLWARSYPDWDPGQKPWNRYTAFNALNRNKLGVTLDIRRPEGRQLFEELVKVSDVVLENNPPKNMDRAGLDYDELLKIKPDLIMARMPAFGQTGPYRDYKAWGTHMEAFIGHTWIRSYRDVDPSLKDDVYPSDAVAGITTAFSILVALRHLRKTGQGQLIDAPLSEGLVPFLAETFLNYTMNGRVQSAMGNLDESMAPHNVYRCMGDDQWVSIPVGSDEEWVGLCRAMGQPSWSRDRRFSHVLGRWRNQEEIDDHVQQWTQGLESRDVMERLQREGVAAGMVQNAEQVHGDPQLDVLGFFQDVTHPEAGTHRYPGIIGHLSDTPNCIRRSAPCLGQHNEYVYQELMGLPYERYQELEALGQIGLDYAT